MALVINKNVIPERMKERYAKYLEIKSPKEEARIRREGYPPSSTRRVHRRLYDRCLPDGQAWHLAGASFEAQVLTYNGIH